MIQRLKTAAAITGAAVFLYVAVLIGLNVYIVRELFRTEYTMQMQSIEGTYMAISRVLMADPSAVWSWWPYWFCGIPFGNTYFPLMHMVDAAVARAAGISPALAYHFVSALMYTLGPVTLFVLLWRMVKMPGVAFVAAAAYELVSPSLWLIPEIALDAGTPWNARRYQAMVAWGEGPHVASLTLVPIALLLLYRVFEGRRRYVVPATLAMTVTMLTSAFGITTLALGGMCLVLAAPEGEWKRRLVWLAALGAVAYLILSPLVPPSVLMVVRANSEFVGGGYKRNLANTLAGAGVGVLLLGIRWVALRFGWPEHIRFFALFASFPLLAYRAHLYAIPQPQRYHLQAEMGLIPLVVLSAWLVVRRWPAQFKASLAAVLLLFAAVQTRHYRHYIKWLNFSTDITQRVEYKTARWIDANLPGERVMTGGSLDTWFNVFANNPQLHGGHDPMSPIPQLRHPVFAAYYCVPEALVWLRAYGVAALVVNGKESQEEWKPFRDPKFYEGKLPVLWREGDDAIYAIPRRSASLAHVMPAGGPVEIEPGGGINRDSLKRFAGLLDDPSLPEASFAWEGKNRARIRAKVAAGQVVSVQMTQHSGWKATAAGAALKTQADGLGLMVIEPRTAGAQEIVLEYSGGIERSATLLLSALALAGLCWTGWKQAR